MVFYLANVGVGVPNYAETDWGYLDADINGLESRIEYLHPKEIPAASRKPGVNKATQGFPIDPMTLPKAMLWAARGGPIPDILPRFVVSQRFRALVERFEPGVHQFVSISIHETRDGPPVANFFWFVVCQRIDSVDRDQTTYEYRAPSDTPEEGFWFSSKRNPVSGEREDIPNASLVFDERKVAGYHIWNDPHILVKGDRLCSDQFAQAAAGENFLGLGMAKQPSIGGGSRQNLQTRL